MRETCSTRYGSLIFCTLSKFSLFSIDGSKYFISMKRVEEGGDWPLFCPNEAPGLHEVWGEEFEALFERYEKEGRAMKVIKAQKLSYAIGKPVTFDTGPFARRRVRAEIIEAQKVDLGARIR